MGKANTEGFQVLDYYMKYRIICIDSSRIAECMAHYHKTKLDGIYLSPHHGFRLTDLAFLKDYPFITRVAVAYSPSIRVSDLSHLKTLRSLTIADNKQPIDFSAFPDLEDLSIDWHSKIAFPEGSKVLKRLRLRNYKPKSKDLTEVPNYRNLRKLEVVRAPLHSLAGLGRFKKLKELQLYYLSKLERIADLDAYSLEVLELDVCKKISDHAHVVNFPKLRFLRLSDCGPVPSLKFLDRMPKLEDFSFVNTNVLDGDMTPCFRLKWAGFLNKKHYSHTSEEVKAIIAERQKKAGS